MHISQTSEVTKPLHVEQLVFNVSQRRQLEPLIKYFGWQERQVEEELHRLHPPIYLLQLMQVLFMSKNPTLHSPHPVRLHL